MHAHTLPHLVCSSRISPAPRKAQCSTSTSNDSQKFSALNLSTGIVLEDLVVSKLPQALPFGFRGWGAGLALEGDVQSQTGAACFSTLNETKSVLLCADAMVMRPSIALGYVTAWSRKYSVTGTTGPYWLYKCSALWRCTPSCLSLIHV